MATHAHDNTGLSNINAALAHELDTPKTAALIRLARAAGAHPTFLGGRAIHIVKTTIAVRYPDRRVPRGVVAWFVSILAASTGRCVRYPNSHLDEVKLLDDHWEETRAGGNLFPAEMTEARYKKALKNLAASDRYFRACEPSHNTLETVRACLALSGVMFDVNHVHAMVCDLAPCQVWQSRRSA